VTGAGEETRKYEAQKALLRQHGIPEAQIQELEGKLLEAEGEGDLLSMAGLGHLGGAGGAPEGGVQGGRGRGRVGRGRGRRPRGRTLSAKVPRLQEEAEWRGDWRRRRGRGEGE